MSDPNDTIFQSDIKIYHSALKINARACIRRPSVLHLGLEDTARLLYSNYNTLFTSGGIQMKLNEARPGNRARIIKVGGAGALRQHFLDMGVIPGAELSVVKYAPMGDPVELLIHGYSLTLRLADCEKIEIELLPAREPEKAEKTEKMEP